MKWRKLFNFIKTRNPIVLTLMAIISLILIAVIDYYLVGAGLQQCSGMNKVDLILFYFSRSMAEYLMLGLGMVIGYKIAEDLK